MGAGLSGSLSCCHFLRGLFRGSLLLHFTRIRIFCSCLGVLCSGGTPGRVFLHFFRKGFCIRACTDFLGKLTQERLFLQRRKIVFKRSYRVRGMGLPQGPAFACTATTINKTKKQKLKKTQVLLRTVIAIKHFGARCENAKCFIVITVLNKTCVFFSFCFFVLLNVVTAHAKADPWGGPMPRTL